jgi:hypothetical protein
MLPAGSFPRLLAVSLFTLWAHSAAAKIIYSEFSGYREWPIAAGSMADTDYAVPVYRTWPDRPYEVFGSLKYENPNTRWDAGDIKQVAKEAKKRGGEAMILRYGSEDAVLAVTGFKMPDLVFGTVQPTALVIRFLSKEETAKREARQKDLFREYLAKNPPGGFSEDTGVLAVKFLLQSGHRLDAPDFLDKFSEIMARIATREPGSLTGEWLFKAVLKTSTITTSDEKSFFGTAVVQSDGTNVVVVSREGGIELNFSGTCTGAKFSGQLGIAGFSAKAEGIALPPKISLTYQTVTASGTAQGSVVLQRTGLAKPETKPTKEKPLKL